LTIKVSILLSLRTDIPYHWLVSYWTI